MTIYSFGSINIDHIHTVPHFPQPGETLSDTGYAVGLGGKGCNQSLAASAAGARVRHIGAVGADGLWARQQMADAGVDIAAVSECPEATGHAVIYVTPDAENQIVIHGGANRAFTAQAIETALAGAGQGDWFLCQNETNMVAEAAAMARARGLRVAYAAAPFDAETAAAMLPLTDLLAVNALEAEALARQVGCQPAALPVPSLLITRGAEGAVWLRDGARTEMPAFEVLAVDTTGAGDTFLGTFLAGLDLGLTDEIALRRAAAAAALQVTRTGAGTAIPTAAELDRFLAERS